MSNWLSGLFSGTNIVAGEQSVSSGNDTTGSASATALLGGTAALKEAFATGTALSGKVVKIDGNQVQIALGTNQAIYATIGDGQAFTVGQELLFAVRSLMNNQISISPLLSNTSGSQMAADALQNANVLMTNETLEMVDSMMKNGMGIDKENVQTMNRLINNFPTYPVSDIVSLKTMGLQVTEENLQQFHNYMNYEHQITTAMSDIFDMLPETFHAMIKEGNDSAAMQLYGDLVNSLGGDGAESIWGLNADGTVAISGNASENVTGNTAPVLGENGIANTVENAAVNADGISETIGTEATSVEDSSKAANSAVTANGATDADKAVILKQLGFDETQTQQALKQNISDKELLSLIKQAVISEKGGISHDARGLFGTKAFQNLINRAMEEAFLLDPKQVGEADSVKDLYTKLRMQVEKLAETVPKEQGSTLAKSVENLKNNIDFINQINHLYSYVQLPLKMSGGKNNGDLYVYTNRKSLATKDGNVTALLHLDMEHLGPVDVHVSMNEANQVQTNFYLKDEEMLDFVYENIGMLTKRLEERGYLLKAVMHVKGENEKTPLQELLPDQKEVDMIGQYSFDARA